MYAPISASSSSSSRASFSPNTGFWAGPRFIASRRLNLLTLFRRSIAARVSAWTERLVRAHTFQVHLETILYRVAGEEIRTVERLFRLWDTIDERLIKARQTRGHRDILDNTISNESQ